MTQAYNLNISKILATALPRHCWHTMIIFFAVWLTYKHYNSYSSAQNYYIFCKRLESKIFLSVNTHQEHYYWDTLWKIIWFTATIWVSEQFCLIVLSVRI